MGKQLHNCLAEKILRFQVHIYKLCNLCAFIYFKTNEVNNSGTPLGKKKKSHPSRKTTKYAEWGNSQVVSSFPSPLLPTNCTYLLQQNCPSELIYNTYQIHMISVQISQICTTKTLCTDLNYLSSSNSIFQFHVHELFKMSLHYFPILFWLMYLYCQLESEFLCGTRCPIFTNTWLTLRLSRYLCKLNRRHRGRAGRGRNKTK